MTAGVQTSSRPARTALILSMAATNGVDIAPRGIFGKPEMPDLRALQAGAGRESGSGPLGADGLDDRDGGTNAAFDVEI